MQSFDPFLPSMPGAVSSTVLERFFTLSPNPICIVGFDGSLRQTNAAWQRTLGYTEDTVWGLPFLDLTHADDRAAAEAALRHLMLTGETVIFVARSRTSAGTALWLEWQAWADLDAQHIFMTARDVTTAQETAARTQLLEALVENAPDGFAVADPEGTLIYLNPAFQTMLGYTSPPIGMRMAHLHTDAEQARIPTIIQHAHDRGAWQGMMAYQRTDHTVFDAQLSVFLVRDAHGQPLAQVKIARDISDQQRSEQERQALQDQIIEAQQKALRELSSPLIPLTHDIVVMPLIGNIDSVRAEQVLEGLLHGVATQRARIAIMDITGVLVVDTQVANVLLQAAQAVKLLGAKVLITGIRPEVAQTLVGLGVDLSDITTHSSLQMGIASALAGRTLRG